MRLSDSAFCGTDRRERLSRFYGFPVMIWLENRLVRLGGRRILWVQRILEGNYIGKRWRLSMGKFAEIVGIPPKSKVGIR